MSTPPPSRYLTLGEAGQLAKLSTRTLRRAIAAGRLPAHRIGRLIRVEAEALCRWIEDVQVKPSAGPRISRS